MLHGHSSKPPVCLCLCLCLSSQVMAHSSVAQFQKQHDGDNQNTSPHHTTPHTLPVGDKPLYGHVVVFVVCCGLFPSLLGFNPTLAGGPPILSQKRHLHLMMLLKQGQKKVIRSEHKLLVAGSKCRGAPGSVPGVCALLKLLCLGCVSALLLSLRSSSYILQLGTRKHLRPAPFGNFPATRGFVYHLQRCKTSRGHEQAIPNFSCQGPPSRHATPPTPL